MKLLPQKWVASFPGLSRFAYFSELLADGAKGPLPGANKKVDWLGTILAVPAMDRPGWLEQRLCERLGQVLRLAASRIELQVPFRQLGLDSLMAVELRNRIDQDFGVTIPIPYLLSDASIAGLSAFVLARLPGADADASSSEQIEEGSI
jgi:acyl carrier protein